MLYICVGFWLLTVGSHDLSQSEKERTACKANKIHNIKTSFTQNENPGPFCEFAQPSKQLFISQFEINHVIQQPKIIGHVDHLS